MCVALRAALGGLCCVLMAMVLLPVSAQAVNPPQTLHTLILLLNYQDTQPTSLSTSQAASDFLADAGAYYESMSYGQVTISAEAHGWYAIPYSVNGTCDIYGYANAGNTAAGNAGVNVSSFDHIIYVLSGGVPSNCAGIAFGTGSLSSGLVWGGPNVVTDVGIARHEFGHSIGLGHADLGPLGGQPLDRLPAAQLVQLGWLDAPTAATGSYTLTSVEQASGLRSLQIARGDGSRLVIEYRSDLGGVYIESDTYGFSYVNKLAFLTANEYFYDATSRTLLNVGSPVSSLSVTLNATAPPPDVTPPGAPVLAGVKGGTKGQPTESLSWSAASDNVAVTAYLVYGNGGLVVQTDAGTLSTVVGLPKRGTMSFCVKAQDQAGNLSSCSNTVS